MPTNTTVGTSVNVREFRKHLSGYLRQASEGGEVVITSHGVEVARIVPPVSTAHQRRQLIGMFKGQILLAPDFDETPEDLIAAMEGEEG